MDHLLANTDKPIPEADDDDEEAVQSLESGEEAKVPIISSLAMLMGRPG